MGVAPERKPIMRFAGAASFSTQRVTDLFVVKLQETGMFRTVIYPYSDLTRAEPDLFVLAPVLPRGDDVTVDLTITPMLTNCVRRASYSSEASYTLSYTTPAPSTQGVEEWISTAELHAVNSVLNQLITGRSELTSAVDRNRN